jgi:hypothetical protein
LAAEQERNRQLLQAKEDETKTAQAAMEVLHLEVENLASSKEDLDAQLRDRDVKLAEAQKEASQLSDVLERYHAEHIQSAETIRSEVLELLGQCNLDAPPTSFPQCTIGAFYKWVSTCFDLITMNTKIFGELGAAVGVRTLAYFICSLVFADHPSSEKTISKSDLRRLMRRQLRVAHRCETRRGPTPRARQELRQELHEHLLRRARAPSYARRISSPE